jgi:hypothetical protein
MKCNHQLTKSLRLRAFILSVLMLLVSVYHTEAQQVNQILYDTGSGFEIVEELPIPTTRNRFDVSAPATISNAFESFPIRINWDQQPWPNTILNFYPGNLNFYPAGDLNGDGLIDRYAFVFGVADERDGNLASRVDKTLIFFGGNLTLEPDHVVYDRLFPVGNLLGGDKSHMISYNFNTTQVTIYTFGNNWVSSDPFTLPGLSGQDIYELFTGNGSNDVLKFYDLNNDGFDDIARIIGSSLWVTFGANSTGSMTYFPFNLATIASQLGYPNGFFVLKDAVELDGSTYFVVGAMSNPSAPDRYALILQIDSVTRELTVLDHVQYLNTPLSGSGSLHVRFMDGVPGNPSLVYSNLNARLTRIISSTSNNGSLGDSTVTSTYPIYLEPLGLLSGNKEAFIAFDGANHFLAYGENGTIVVTGEPVFNGGNVRYFDPFTASNRYRRSYGDLTGNGADDAFIAVSTDDGAGQLLLSGDANFNFGRTPLIYDFSLFGRKIRSDTFTLGDVTGNGLDDFAIFINAGSSRYIEIYEGGGSFQVPVHIIPVPYTSVRFIDAGYFSSTTRKDIVVLGLQTNVPNSNAPFPFVTETFVHFYQGGSTMGTTPYKIIKDVDAFPYSWLSNVLSTMINVGDVTNNGYDDLLLGTPTVTFFETGQKFPAALYVGGPNMGGSADHLILDFHPDAPNGRPGNWFGNTLHALGDINGDGIPDFAIASTDELLPQPWNGAGHQGVIHIYFGRDSSKGNIDFSQSDLILRPNVNDAMNGNRHWVFGFGEIATGDFNGSGYLDIAVTAFWHRNIADGNIGVPAIHIYNGGPGLSDQPDHMVGLFGEVFNPGGIPPGYTTFMGHPRLKTIPDLNSSGHDELVVMAGVGYVNGVLLRGSDESLIETPYAVFRTPFPHVPMGPAGNFINVHYKTTAGDFTGDGFIDIIVAQPSEFNFRDTPVLMFTTADYFEADPSAVILSAQASMDVVFPGNRFTLDISAGNSEFPVQDLSGLGFQISINPDMFTLVDVTVGPLMYQSANANDVIDFFTLDADSTFAAMSFARVGSVSGVNGHGIVASLEFEVKNISDSNYSFRFSDVLAINSNGDALDIVHVPGFVQVFDGVFVWPGDTNNDGVVDIEDVLPVAAWFGQTGPARTNFNISWSPQPARRWSIPSYTFADATGAGIINQNDIIPIGLNFGKTVPGSNNRIMAREVYQVAELVIPAGFTGRTYAAVIRIQDEGVPEYGLLGVAAEFSFDSEIVSVQSIKAGTLLEHHDLLSFTRAFGENKSNYAAAFSRKGVHGPVFTSGEVLSITFDLNHVPTSDVIISLDRLLLSGMNGSVITSQSHSFDIPTLTSTDDFNDVPNEFSLSHNYPNPFNPTTSITFALPQNSDVRLEVYDMTGRRVAMLVNSMQPAGRHTITFDASHLASGTYLYRLRAGSFEQTRTMMLIK